MNVILREYSRRLFETLHIGSTADMVKFLSNGADTDVANEDGMPAILYVAEMNRPSIMSLFLNKGADANIQDPIGDTALHVAVKKYVWTVDKIFKKDAYDIVEMLLKHKADPYLKNDRGLNAAYIARIYRSTDIINLMVDYV